MSIEYRLYNHSNKTYFELGKGPWYHIDTLLKFVKDPDFFAEYLDEIWESFNKEKSYIEYFRALGKAIYDFTSDTTLDKLKCVSDCGDENMYSYLLGYKCVGSRYNLQDPEENKNNIDECNRQKPYLDGTVLNDKELKWLRQEGWKVE
jgi:hypothetical protein